MLTIVSLNPYCSYSIVGLDTRSGTKSVISKIPTGSRVNRVMVLCSPKASAKPPKAATPNPVAPYEVPSESPEANPMLLGIASWIITTMIGQAALRQAPAKPMATIRKIPSVCKKR